jgi:hypothetical protein
VCGRLCAAVYQLAEDEPEMCADCYKLAVKVLGPPRPRCAECGAQRVTYREPRSDDIRFLCTPCHKAAGHRYQENGTWIDQIQSDLL